MRLWDSEEFQCKWMHAERLKLWLQISGWKYKTHANFIYFAKKEIKLEYDLHTFGIIWEFHRALPLKKNFMKSITSPLIIRLQVKQLYKFGDILTKSANNRMYCDQSLASKAYNFLSLTPWRNELFLEDTPISEYLKKEFQERTH